jgi:REP element-mobilizing transposase RayT
MAFDPGKHHRRSVRLPFYDYSQAGMYFGTLCTLDRKSIFGLIEDGQTALNPIGEIARSCWMEMPGHFPGLILDQFVLMPNHLHGILTMEEQTDPISVGARYTSPLHPTLQVPSESDSLPDRFIETRRKQPKCYPLGTIIGTYKSSASRAINRLRNTPGAPVWQRNYYERVIRSDAELHALREYIVNNPLKWDLDPDNFQPSHTYG